MTYNVRSRTIAAEYRFCTSRRFLLACSGRNASLAIRLAGSKVLPQARCCNVLERRSRPQPMRINSPSLRGGGGRTLEFEAAVAELDGKIDHLNSDEIYIASIALQTCSEMAIPMWNFRETMRISRSIFVISETTRASQRLPPVMSLRWEHVLSPLRTPPSRGRESWPPP